MKIFWWVGRRVYTGWPFQGRDWASLHTAKNQVEEERPTRGCKGTSFRTGFLSSPRRPTPSVLPAHPGSAFSGFWKGEGRAWACLPGPRSTNYVSNRAQKVVGNRQYLLSVYLQSEAVVFPSGRVQEDCSRKGD